jgi:hypothetical protein
MKKKEDKLKIMVSSTVYGREDDLDQIYAILSGYGYKVVMSKEGTLYQPIHASIPESCLKAVEECDLFLGIIFPRYGSGITHQEFKKAIELDRPRWFIAHQYVIFARNILSQYMFKKDGTSNKSFKFKETDMMDSVGAVHMYNDALMNNLKPEERRSNWVQPFFKTHETFKFLETQFEPIEKRRSEIEEHKGIKK